jgi:uncharacterized membrane protein
MTDEQRNAVQRLVQISLRRRASQSVDAALADESLIRQVTSQLAIPDNLELRNLIQSAANPIRVELQDAGRRQAVQNFWLARSHTKLVILPLLAIVLTIAAVLRLDRIGSQSQWLDEYWAVYLATGRGNLIFDMPFGQLIDSPPPVGFIGAPALWHIWPGITSVTHPPLYYLTLRAWIDLFGDGDVATRMMSTVFSLAAIVLMFDAVRRSSSSTAQGLAAAAMMTFAPAQIDFSQTTRPYTMVTFLGLLVCDLLINIKMKGPSRLRTAGLFLAFVALALTHYFTAGAFLAIALFSLLGLQGKTRRAVLVAMILAFAFVLAAWGPMFWRARQLLALDSFVRGNGIDIFGSFINLPRRLLLHLSLETGFLTMLAFAAVIYLSPPLRIRRNPQLLLWWLWAICVPGFLLLWDVVRHTHFITVVRYVLLDSPAIFAIFATPFPTRIGKLVPAAFVLAAAVSAFARWQAGPYPLADIRAASHWIQSDVPRGDPVVICSGEFDADPPFTYFAIAHYIGQWQHPVVLLQKAADARLQTTLARYPHVWIWTRGPLDPKILPNWNFTLARHGGGFALTEATPTLPNPLKSR